MRVDPLELVQVTIEDTHYLAQLRTLLVQCIGKENGVDI